MAEENTAAITPAADTPNDPTATPQTGAQQEPPTDPLAALCVLARLHQTAADPATLAHQIGLQPHEQASTQDLLRAAKHLGLRAKLSRTSVDRLPLSPLPALALLRGADGAVRTVVLAQCDGHKVLLQAPGGHPVIESMEVFAAQWTGELILVTSRVSLVGELARSTSRGSFPVSSSTAGFWVRCC